MSYKLNPKHIENVLKLAAPQRYAYFIKRVADWRSVWALSVQGRIVSANDDGGKELVPVWPHPHFGQLCATGEWSGAQPEEIDITEWLKDWTSRLTEEHRLVAVFLLPNGQGIHVNPVRIAEDLRTELSRF